MRGLEVNPQLMRSETKKGEKMKKSINLKDTKDVKYLCSWNNNDIIQIHTKQTLLNEYKETNHTKIFYSSSA